MERRTKVFQIVGFQNSGKTTLIQEILKFGEGLGLRIGTIKHHGHGGSPSAKHIEKDSEKHLHAGAAIAAVEGNGELLILNQTQKWTLPEIIKTYEQYSLQFILIEGYKNAEYPKVVLIRNEKDLVLLNKLTNIQAVLTWYPIKETINIPVFSISNTNHFITWLYQTLFEDDTNKDKNLPLEQ